MTVDRLRGRRLAWALTAVLLIVCGIGAAVWMTRDTSKPNAAGDDCTVVKKLVEQWVTMSESVKSALETGPGERRDMLAAADRESAMSEKLRAAADSVSSPAFKEHFNKWAKGAALTAEIQRESVNRPFQVETPPDLQFKMRNAAVMTDEASGSLIQACPEARQALPGH